MKTGTLRTGDLVGFTLIELLVVLTIMALLVLIAMPRIQTVLPNMEVRSDARELAASLREARSEAISTDQDALFTIDLNKRAYAISGEKQSHLLRGDVALALYTAQQEIVAGSSANIRFFPDGSSTGGSISISRGALSYRVTVDWLTGTVDVSRANSQSASANDSNSGPSSGLGH